MSENDNIEEVEIPFNYALKYPFEVGTGENKKEITELTIDRRPKAVDFKGLSAGSMKADDAIRVLSRLCAVPVSFIEQVDAWDFIKLQGVFSSFLPDGG